MKRIFQFYVGYLQYFFCFIYFRELQWIAKHLRVIAVRTETVLNVKHINFAASVHQKNV